MNQNKFRYFGHIGKHFPMLMLFIVIGCNYCQTMVIIMSTALRDYWIWKSLHFIKIMQLFWKYLYGFCAFKKSTRKIATDTNMVDFVWCHLLAFVFLADPGMRYTRDGVAGVGGAALSTFYVLIWAKIGLVLFQWPLIFEK